MSILQFFMGLKYIHELQHIPAKSNASFDGIRFGFQGLLFVLQAASCPCLSDAVKIKVAGVPGRMEDVLVTDIVKTSYAARKNMSIRLSALLSVRKNIFCFIWYSGTVVSG